MLAKLADEPYYLWAFGTQDMPGRLADFVLNCVVYIYPSFEHAKKGKKAGGSGFIVGVRSKQYEGKYMPYAVTNSHVVKEVLSKELFTVIRVNKKDGTFGCIARAKGDWTHHRSADLAVTPLVSSFPANDIGDEYKVDYFIQDEWFADNDYAKSEDIGIGDEVYIVGRFHMSDGKSQNLPTVRWGNIAQMPNEAIKIRGKMQKVYLVECHSISGFSGSPVFVYIDMMKSRPTRKTVSTGYYTTLLGIDCGHLGLDEYVNERKPVKIGNFELPPKWDINRDLKVTANSAMMAVVPVEKLRELLNYKDLVMVRKKIDRAIKEELDRKPDDVIPDNLVVEEGDFKATLRKVARRVNPSESDKPKPKT